MLYAKLTPLYKRDCVLAHLATPCSRAKAASSAEL